MFYMVKILLVLGCAASFSVAEEINLSGIYVVPTSDRELTQAAQFKVSEYKVIGPNSAVPVIQFKLPLELTGVSQVLEFKRVMVLDSSDKSALFKSQFGSALCYGAWKSLKCFFKFRNLPMDPVQAVDSLSALFQGLAFTEKLTIVNRFMGEPVGILQIDVVESLP